MHRAATHEPSHLFPCEATVWSRAILGAVANRLDIDDLKQRLLGHDMYQRLTSIGAMRLFMEVHVFAVWDFLSLLKALQRRFTCVEVPWVPRGDPEIRRLINQIVLDEESDVGPSGDAGVRDACRSRRSARGDPNGADDFVGGHPSQL